MMKISYFACFSNERFKTISSAPSIARRFAKDEDGGITVLTLILLVLMLVMGGMAVDFMRHEGERVYLQGVADRSVLAGASLTQDIDGDVLVEDFFDKAGRSASIVGNPSFTNEANQRSVGVVAQQDLGTFYLRFLGIDDLAMTAAAGATEGVGKVEISLVIDVSASMRESETGPDMSEADITAGRIADLRVAADAFAKSVLDPVYGGQVSLNIIPFAGSTNPGPEMFEILGGTGKDDNYFILPYNAILPGDDTPMASIEQNADGSMRLDINRSDVSPVVVDLDDLGSLDPYSRGIVKGVLDDTTTLSEVNGDEIYFDLNGDGIVDSTTSDRMTVGNIDDVVFTDPGDFRVFSDDYILDNENVLLVDANDVLQLRYEPPQSCINLTGSSNWNNAELPAPGQDIIPQYMAYNYANFEILQNGRNFGWCPPDTTTILYGENDINDIGDFISTLTLSDGTGTDVAMKWGLALLDPSSADELQLLNANAGDDAFPDEFAGNRPAPYAVGGVGTQKILILMTDGEITPQYRPVTGTEKDPARIITLPAPGDDMDDAENWLGAHTTGAARQSIQALGVSRNNLSRICTLAKGNDIEVYTVAFEFQSRRGADDRLDMENCATPDSAETQYFYEASGSGLTDVFEDIASQITQLRLTN